MFRGSDFGNSPHIQPSLTYSINGFSIGAWGAYPIDSEPTNGTEEFDISFGYTLDIANGSLVIGLADYYYPNVGKKYFDYNDGDGAHTLEASLAYYGAINLITSMTVFNDEDHSLYAELGITRKLGNITLDVFAGASLKESTAWSGIGWYGNKEAALINIGIKGAKEIPITDKFSLPVSSTVILNPDAEKAFLVFALSL